MTRRRVIFTDSDGSYYTSPEFSGDKEEFENKDKALGKSFDGCNMNWSEIISAYFNNVKTVADFKSANEKAQKEYISFLGDEILPIRKITWDEALAIAKTCQVYLISTKFNKVISCENIFEGVEQI